MSKQNKTDAIIANTLKNLNGLIDVNTVIGAPIKTEQGMLIPLSKVTYGYLTGGGEYGDVKFFKKGESLPFSGGSGAVVSIKPTGFLFDSNGEIKILSCPGDSVERLAGVCENLVNSVIKNEEN